MLRLPGFYHGQRDFAKPGLGSWGAVLARTKKRKNAIANAQCCKHGTLPGSACGRWVEGGRSAGGLIGWRSDLEWADY
ncbi:hypothetical protein SV7mr_28390 [Stieleria bergensis]|uniref:Uncharacterized protein n=1 Tax=Stieleria bergensis TaxID=2528025 RepID=A0A517SW09_9BACT|nr:hypothetical protein SV7mr_28390 [Planctomycetes bacterium SV_7m_r]